MENNEEEIKTLTWQEHMRLRPEMYVGKLGDGSDIEDGVYAMLRGIINDAVDESYLGFGNQIMVTLDGNRLTLRNFGRGLPFRKLEEKVSCVDTGGMHDDFYLPTLEYQIICALSSEMTIESYRDGKMKRINASRGEITENENPIETDQPNGIFISFIPDKDIFGDYKLDAQIIGYILAIYAAGTPDMELSLDDEVYHHPDGIMGLLKEHKDVDLQNAMYISNCGYDLAIAPVTGKKQSKIIPIVNGHLTLNGGPHVDVLVEALFEVLKQSQKETQQCDICSGFFMCLNIKIDDPICLWFDNLHIFKLWTKSVLDSVTKFNDYFKADLKENLLSIFREDCDKKRAFFDAITKQRVL